ncbi:MAG: NUDIX hydrolase, partial [Chloroflexota bacterium]|nr:NUDIX hydrolase [Chloroflexota bacterium]
TGSLRSRPVARAGRRSRRGGRHGTGPVARPARASAASAAWVANGAARESAARGPLVRDVSAGGVVYRRGEAGGAVEVALVGRVRPRRWALPKGTPEVGETLEGTAVREVGEETGLLVRIEQPLDQIQYWFVWGGVRHFKTVHFYLMQMVGGDTANHDGEYDVVEWFPITEALRRLSYPNEARVVDKAQRLLGAGA